VSEMEELNARVVLYVELTDIVCGEGDFASDMHGRVERGQNKMRPVT
jgi:hypothetical protein